MNKQELYEQLKTLWEQFDAYTMELRKEILLMLEKH
jgi:hypothetical protein